jgi:diacylglycerol kinase family enzyme
MLQSTLGFGNQKIHLTVDDTEETLHTIKSIAVCNGKYFGGSMYIAPHAEPDDGQFEIIILGDAGLMYMILKSSKVYKGTHLDEPQVSMLSGKIIEARPQDDTEHVLLDVDGEGLGRLPARIEILPSSLKLRC